VGRHGNDLTTRPLFRGGVALLVVLAAACAGGGSNPRSSPSTSVSPSAQVPTLEILSPRSGDRVSAPVPISYVVTGFTAGLDSGYLIVYVGDPGSSLQFDLRLSGATGVVHLDDHPMLSGKRDLTLQLAENHQPLTNPEATVTLHDVIIEGKRGSGNGP
jgi:hypothetical protein